MKYLSILFASLCLASCTTLQPRIYNNIDPFTGVVTRTMSVSESDATVFWRSLANASTPYSYSPPVRNVSALPLDYRLGLSVTANDTLLTLARVSPERAFDVPASSEVLIRFFGVNRTRGGIIRLPIVRKYHTIGGPLVVSASVSPQNLEQLRRHAIDVIRIDKVSTNESDYLPIDWFPPIVYSSVFEKGVGKLMGQDDEPKPIRKKSK